MTDNQCETLFEYGFRCQGIKGHEGCCQDIDFDGCNGEQYTYYNGKNWCNPITLEIKSEQK